MTNKIIQTFLSLGIILLLSACCKERKLLYSFTFSAEQKACIPYQAQQKMRFLRKNSTDITTITAGEITDKLEEEPCGPECCDYFLIEDYRLFLDADYPAFNFQLSLRNNIDSTKFGIGIYLNHYDFFINNPEKACGDSVANRICFDSLKLNDKMYYQVIESKTSAQDSLVRPFKIWYNQTYGILQFQFTDSTTYTLLP